jgi:pentatricopeptide repeat protein
MATMGACVKCQEADAAIGLLRAMQRKGLPLGLKPYNLVIVALTLCGRATEAFHVLQEMIQQGNSALYIGRQLLLHRTL